MEHSQSARRPQASPHLALALVVAALTGCGAEREFTGVWQQVCEPDQAEAPCADFVVEAHLGRYGDKVTGLLVRYRLQDVALDPYQRSNECGCWFLQGGRAQEDRLAFALFEPAVPRVPDEAFAPDEACAPRAADIPPACEDALYSLRADGDDLVGEVRCGAEARTVRLRPTSGSPRRVCLPVPAP